MMAIDKTMQCKHWAYLACVLLPMGASVACAPTSQLHDPAQAVVREQVADRAQPSRVQTPDRERGEAQAVPAQRAVTTPTEPVQRRSQSVSSDLRKPATDVVYFRFDSIELSASARRLLESYVKYVKASGARLRIEGHTDERGTREYNLALAQLRAESVARQLTLLGVPRTRLDPVSLGEEVPAELGSNERSWARNRRSQIIILGSGGAR